MLCKQGVVLYQTYSCSASLLQASSLTTVGGSRLKKEKGNGLASCNIWQVLWSPLSCVGALALQSVVANDHFIWKDWMSEVAFHLL